MTTRLYIKILILLSAFAMGGRLCAQDFYQQAQEHYEAGHFAQCDSLLLANLSSVGKTNIVGAYRLLTLSSLNQDDPEQAENYAAELLKFDPFYTPYNDPQRFVDLIERLKHSGESTITTASRLAETVRESPVPVTLITEDMIRISGAQTLRDLICLYVPSMTRVEGLESNVCMRGIVGANQEDILIMLDGVRQNSGSTNSEAPDFHISLDKIKQIEILRGPASSLYGNVALMAVVNIITKRGSELNSTSLGVRTGMHHTIGGNFMTGYGNLRTDVVAWGSVYYSKGQLVDYEGTPHYIGGFRDKPAFDLGLKARWQDLMLSVTGQQSKMVPFFNQIALAPYSYDRYTKSEGCGPGTSRTTINAALNYQHTWNAFALNASLYGSSERVQIFNCLGDSVPPALASGLLNSLGVPGFSDGIGLWETMRWNDYNFGVNIGGDLNYRLGTQKGSLLVGAQMELFNLSSSHFQLGTRFNEVSMGMPEIIDNANEYTLSGYLQIKHYFTPQLIFNGGLRYDYKIRFNRHNLNNLSPRAAIIWMPNSIVSAKLGYARSFVDAPYIYRANKLPMYTGGSDLSYQTNDAYQAGVMTEWKHLGVKAEVNMFYHQVRNLVIYSFNSMAAGDAPFSSASIDIGGVEAVAEYNNQKLGTYAHLNLSYKYAFRMKHYSNFEHRIGNEPYFQGNIVAGQRLYRNPRVGQFGLHANLHFQTDAQMELNNLAAMLTLPEDQVKYNDYTPAQCMLNLGAEWHLNHWRVSADVYNVTNNRGYRVGSQLQSWIPAQGIQVIGKLQFTF